MKTVYVIGAGASAEAGLPTGSDLKAHIGELLNIRFQRGGQQASGDYEITQALRNIVHRDRGGDGNINPYLHEAWHIVGALPLAISIDNFLDAHRDNACIEFLGKIAIVRSILQAERNSKLFVETNVANPSLDFEAISNTWYIPFFQLLTENCGRQDLEDRFSELVRIIFNNDRCIEHFILYALKRYYNLTDIEAAKMIQHIEIYHPYGATGGLEWSDAQNRMPFGAEPNAQQLVQILQGIRTFTEGTDPKESEILAIRRHVFESSKLVFLGFAFHQLNMQLLTPQELNPKQDSFKCFASAFNISKSDRNAIQEQINNLFGMDVDTNFANLKCSDFFQEFWRSLAF